MENIFVNFGQCSHEPCSERYPIIFFVKESKVVLCNGASTFLTFNAPLLFKSCVFDLNGRIGKPSGFFNYPSFSNTKIFNRAVHSSVVFRGNCMTASGVAIISVIYLKQKLFVFVNKSENIARICTSLQGESNITID